jgi:predicted DNA-binding transcriptional regulator AlpA
MKAKPVEQVLLDVRQTMAMFGLSKSSIYKLSAAGRFPRPVRIGRSTRWRADELRAWLADGCPPLSRWRGVPGGKGAMS